MKRCALGPLSLVLSLVACSGGMVHLDGPLAARPAMPVSGSHVGIVSPQHDPFETGMSAAFGDTVATVSEVRTDLARGPAMGEKFLGDVEKALVEVHNTQLAATLASQDSRVQLLQSVDQSANGGQALGTVAKAVDSAASTAADAEQFLVALRTLLSIPRSATETMTFSVIAQNDRRTSIAVCASSDTVHPQKFFDGPHFSMTCRILAPSDGATYELRVAASGGWLDYRFSGTLRGKQSFTFSSQQMKALGVSSIRGFELRDTRGQVALLHHFEVDGTPGYQQKYIPKVRLLDDAKPQSLRDAIATTMAIAYLFPWPTPSSEQQKKEAAVNAK